MKQLGIFLGLTLALVACGSPTPPANKNMSEAQLQGVATTMDSSVELMIKQAALGSFGVPTMGMGAAGFAKQAECSTTEGSTTDADKDGIPSNLKYSFDCSGDGYSIKGFAQITDQDDNNPQSGAKYETDFSMNITSSKGYAKTNLKYSVNFTPKADKGFNLDYQTSGNVEYSMTDNGKTEQGSGTFSYNLNTESTPDATGVRVVFSGDLSGNSNIPGQVFAGSASFNGDVHYGKQCGGIDSGFITFKSGDAKYTKTYSGCEQI